MAGTKALAEGMKQKIFKEWNEPFDKLRYKHDTWWRNKHNGIKRFHR